MEEEDKQSVDGVGLQVEYWGCGKVTLREMAGYR